MMVDCLTIPLVSVFTLSTVRKRPILEIRRNHCRPRQPSLLEEWLTKRLYASSYFDVTSTIEQSPKLLSSEYLVVLLRVLGKDGAYK